MSCIFMPAFSRLAFSWLGTWSFIFMSCIFTQPFERAMVVSYALHCDHCAISNHSSLTLMSMGGGQFGAEFGEERVNRCKANFNRIWETYMGCHGQEKLCRHFLSLEHNAQKWRTDRPRNGSIYININGEIASAMSAIKKEQKETKKRGRESNAEEKSMPPETSSLHLSYCRPIRRSNHTRKPSWRCQTRAT